MLLSSIALFLAVILFFVGYLPSLAMAQQQQQTTTTTTSPPPPSLSITTIPPLTPEEQERQNRLQNVIAATNQNLNETEKQVGGIVYTPRWSDVVWVEPDSLSILIAYCLPGEFAESGQEILGGFELEVLESYEIALPQGFMAWTMVIGNEDRQDRLPAAVGVICASDLNEAEARVLSPQEQLEINNVVQQFTTQVTNIEQVINIINNVTVNATTPVTPPLPTNDTGGTPPPGGGGGVPGGGAGGIPENATAEADRTPPVIRISVPASQQTNDPQGAQINYGPFACDEVDGVAYLEPNNILIQDSESDVEQQCGLPIQDPIGGDITISCNPPPGSIFPVGETTVQCTAVDQAGNTGTASFTVRVRLLVPVLTVPQNIIVEASTLPGLPAPSSANVKYSVTAQDDGGNTATLEEDGITRQDEVLGDISISCDPPSGSEFPVGVTTVQCTATDASGNTGTASFTVRVNRPPIESPFLAQEQPPPPPPAAIEEQEPPVVEEEAPVEEQEPPVVEEEAPVEDEGAASPPANDEGGG